MPQESPAERAALDRLKMVRVAKDMFSSDWYSSACDVLRFSETTCNELGRISRESVEERERAMALVQHWAEQAEPPQVLDPKALEIARTARRDFLLNLIDIKTSAGESFERAARLAPPSLRPELENLAAIDFRHAVELRELLAREVQVLGGPESR